MAVIATATPWGYTCTATGGTAIAALATPIINKSVTLRVLGIVCGGSAATDIVRVYDGSMNAVFMGSAAATSVDRITFPRAFTMYGACIGVSGGTYGWVNLILE